MSYYEEPLVSLITSMIRAIDEETNIFSETIRNDVGVALKKIAVQVMRKGLDVVKDKTGIDVNEIIDTANGISDEANEQIKSKYAFNEQLQLQKSLMSLHDEIIKLSEERTVVFFVDELDRCLPEYAIRVLERLMSAGRWDEIEFDKIPSRAGMIYKNAFARHDLERMKSEKNVQTYADFAKDKNTKVNAKALYPYEVVKKAMEYSGGAWGYYYDHGYKD